MSLDNPFLEVKTRVTISYRVHPNKPGKLIRRELHRVKDITNDSVVVVYDEKYPVDTAEWIANLNRTKARLEARKAERNIKIDSEIGILTEQINEIESL